MPGNQKENGNGFGAPPFRLIKELGGASEVRKLESLVYEQAATSINQQNGAQIRTAYETSGLRLSDLAALADVDDSQVRKIVTSHEHPERLKRVDPQVVRRVATLLNVQMKEVDKSRTQQQLVAKILSAFDKLQPERPRKRIDTDMAVVIEVANRIAVVDHRAGGEACGWVTFCDAIQSDPKQFSVANTLDQIGDKSTTCVVIASACTICATREELGAFRRVLGSAIQEAYCLANQQQDFEFRDELVVLIQGIVEIARIHKARTQGGSIVDAVEHFKQPPMPSLAALRDRIVSFGLRESDFEEGHSVGWLTMESRHAELAMKVLSRFGYQKWKEAL